MSKWQLPSILLSTLAITLMSPFACAPFAYADEAHFVSALRDLKAGKIPEAEGKLLQIKISDPLFLDAFTELQKIRFHRGDWRTFFGNALFYRKKYLSHKDYPQSNFRARLLELESVALAKHCQWDQARALAKASIDMGYSLGTPVAKDLSELRETLYYIELSHQFPVTSAKYQADLPNGFFSSLVLWKVRNPSIARIRHPELLRIRVENRCGS